MERNTRQRAAIRQALGEAGRPLSPAEVLAAAQSRVPGLGIATVYRALAALVDEGSVTVVELPGAPDRYEVAGKHAHHHFVCRRCDRVFETDACTVERVCVTPPPGFRIETHEVVLRGVCGECAAAG
jgi:Fur family ferric uptake transcriptional regulator